MTPTFVQFCCIFMASIFLFLSMEYFLLLGKKHSLVLHFVLHTGCGLPAVEQPLLSGGLDYVEVLKFTQLLTFGHNT